MSKKRIFTLKLLSHIDDEIVDRNLNKRFLLWCNKSKYKRKAIVPVLAVAAGLLLVVASVALTLFFLNSGKNSKSIPIYQGMTISDRAPVVQESALAQQGSGHLTFHSSLLSLNRRYSEKLLLSLTEHSFFKDTEKDDDQTLEITGGTYYAQKNEDIYIYVHLSNPDGFEILSFTLNGVKYSSYMFEDGSDLETLILKYNVGDVEGVQQYTIDAIKYADGDELKDVRMDGEKTIEVLVGSNDTNVTFNERFEGWELVIDPVWSDSVVGEKRFTSLAVYDGEALIREFDPDTTVLEGLPMDSRLLLVATYMNDGETVTQRRVIHTPKQSEGLVVVNGTIAGIGSCSEGVLYLNMPIAEGAFAEAKYVNKVYFGSGVTSIGARAFEGCTSLSKLSFSVGLTEIGDAAFASCSLLAEIVLPESVKSLGTSVFAYCDSLTEMVIPKNVKTLGAYAFLNCDSLHTVRIESSTIEIDPSNSNVQIYDPDVDAYVPRPVGTVFDECPALTSVYFNGTVAQWEVATSKLEGWYEVFKDITVYCSDGDVVIEGKVLDEDA